MEAIGMTPRVFGPDRMHLVGAYTGQPPIEAGV
jgi:hypothetical protein